MVYPVTATLLSKYLKDTQGESAKVSQSKQQLTPADVSSASKVAYIASFLDPRHKHRRLNLLHTQRCVSSSGAAARAVNSPGELDETEQLAKKTIK